MHQHQQHPQKLINYETGGGSPSHQQQLLLITTNANQSFNNKRYTTSTTPSSSSTAGTTLTSKNSVVTDDVRNNNLPSSTLASYTFYHQTSSPSPPPPIPPSLSSLVAGKSNNNNISKKQSLERRNSLISLNSQHRQPMHISVDDNVIISSDNSIHGGINHTIYPITNPSSGGGGKRSPAMIYQHYQQQNNSQQRKNYASSTVRSDTMSMLDNDIFIPSTSSSKSQSKIIINSNKCYHSPPIPSLLSTSANVSHQMSPKSMKYVTGGEDLSPHHQNHYPMNNKPSQQYEWIETTGVKVPAMPITIATQPGLGGYWMQLENNERIWCSTDSK